MAGYQRHKFDTTYVQPNSDGGWGALARGFSNGYSMGKSITNAINQHNISEANKEYEKAVEDANTQTVKPQQAIDTELVQQGTPERARLLKQSELDKLDPKAREYFQNFRNTQEANGNTPEYKYDYTTRTKMIGNAGQTRDKAIKDSYLRWMGQEAYDEYKMNQSKVSEADFKRTLFEGRKNILDRVAQINKDPQAGLQLAIESGVFPQGTTLDPKTMIATKPDGTTMQITPQMYNGFVRDWQRDQAMNLITSLGEVFEADTYGDRIKAIKLGNDKIINDMKNNDAKTAQGWELVEAKKKIADKYNTKNGGKLTYRTLDDGSAVQLDQNGKPTGMKMSANGELYEAAFKSFDGYQTAVTQGEKMGIQKVVNKDTGEQAFRYNGKLFPNYFSAFSQASKQGVKEKKSDKTVKPLSKEEQAKRKKANEVQRKALEGDQTVQTVKGAVAPGRKYENPVDYFPKLQAIDVDKLTIGDV